MAKKNVLAGDYLFVGHQKGEFEGTKYDNVKLSDGVRLISIANKTGQDISSLDLIPEQSYVTAEFRLSSVKERANLTLIKISKLT